MHYLNFVLFKFREKEVKVKHLISPILFLLLLFLLYRCSNDSTTNQKEEAVENICEVSKRNIDSFYQLLNRSDICSEQWWKDMSDYKKGLQEQNTLLEDKEMIRIQEEMLDAMEVFEENQSEDTIKRLEEVVKKYQNYNSTICEEGNI